MTQPDPAGGPQPDAEDPDRYLQGEAVTLIDVLDRFAATGFPGQFDVHEHGVRCLHCRVTTAPPAVAVQALRRLEGASDPADMLAVAALRCPHCGTQGTLVVNFGPEATSEEDEVLQALPDPA
jgi:hypothetical protein